MKLSVILRKLKKVQSSRSFEFWGERREGEGGIFFKRINKRGVLCNPPTYRVMGEDKPALYYIDSPDQETMLKAGFVDVQPCLWVKVLTDEEYNEITNILY